MSRKKAAEERERFENEYFEAVAKARNIIDSKKINAGVNAAAAVASGSASQGQIHNQTVDATVSHAQAKLPLLGLPRFFGEYDK